MPYRSAVIAILLVAKSLRHDFERQFQSAVDLSIDAPRRQSNAGTHASRYILPSAIGIRHAGFNQRRRQASRHDVRVIFDIAVTIGENIMQFAARVPRAFQFPFSKRLKRGRRNWHRPLAGFPILAARSCYRRRRAGEHGVWPS